MNTRIVNHYNSNCVVVAQVGQLDAQFNFVREGKLNPMEKGAYLSGWCMGASREAWEGLILNHRYDTESNSVVPGGAPGPWNEKYFLYYEDDDLSWRAKTNGYRLEIVDIPVTHFSRVTGRKYNMFTFLKKSQRIFRADWKTLV